MKINGVTVVDAKRPLRLMINEADCTLGNTKDPGACAAARCLLRKKDVEAARVHVARTYVKLGNKWFRYATSPALRSEIVAFDRGGKFEPGEYFLKPIRASEIALRGQAHSVDGPTRGRPGHKRAYHVLAGVRTRGANK